MIFGIIISQASVFAVRATLTEDDYYTAIENDLHEYTSTYRNGTTAVDKYYADTTNVIGIPYDVPVVGYNAEVVNTLRLWSARAEKDLDMLHFSGGDYLRAVEEKALADSASAEN